MVRLTLPCPIALAAVGIAPWIAPSSLAAQTTTPVFDRLAGQWQGEGTLMGRSAAFTMTWMRHGDLAVLTFGNAFADSAGQVTPVLDAAAVYRTLVATPEAVWLDSRGVRIELDWQATDSTLVADWTAPGETGRTTYRVVGPDVIEVTDEVRTDEGWRTFAAARYGRAPAP
jgi:hypothetical protein